MAGAMSGKRFIIFGGLLLLLVLSACSAGQTAAPTASIVEVTREIEKTVLVTQVVEKVITATPEPTLISPTADLTAETPAVPAPAGSDDLFTGWCVPKDVQVSADEVRATGAMPAGSNPLQVVNGEKSVVIEVQNCSFEYTFNTAVPTGAQVKMYDNSSSPFLTLSLTPVTQSPNKGLITITHPYVINPPFWTIPYRLDLVSADGMVLRSDTVNFRRGWTPRTCYDGSWPDPVTLKCKFMGEAHPWDPWYGKENPYEPTPALGE